jgi:hydrogenase expression/formation protein HypC
MCLAIPGKVLSIKGKQAKVDFGNIQKDVFLGAIKPKVGDYVLVGSGIAVQIISKKDAMNIAKEWEKFK